MQDLTLAVAVVPGNAHNPMRGYRGIDLQTAKTHERSNYNIPPNLQTTAYGLNFIEQDWVHTKPGTAV